MKSFWESVLSIAVKVAIYAAGHPDKVHDAIDLVKAVKGAR